MWSVIFWVKMGRLHRHSRCWECEWFREVVPELIGVDSLLRGSEFGMGSGIECISASSTIGTRLVVAESHR
jgi:hypothetical protein